MSMPRLTTLQALVLGLALDLAIVAAITVLGALRVLPGEACVGLLGTLLGARAMRGRGGGDGGSSLGTGPSSPTLPLARGGGAHVSEFSTVAVLAGALLGFLVPHHHHASET